VQSPLVRKSQLEEDGFVMPVLEWKVHLSTLDL
jgi:hypothetical protein